MGNIPQGEPFRVAFCIECHKYTPVLHELCRLLQHPDHTVFVHVDRKARLRDFAPLEGLVRFTEKRSRVHWGRFGQIEAMLNLMDATRQGVFRYIAMLSGDSLPLLPAAGIRDFLAAHYPMQFVPMQPALDIREIRMKMQKKHYYDKTTLPRYIARKWCNWFLPLGNRGFDTLPPLEKGSNWIIITDEFRDFVSDYLRDHPQYLRAFRHAHCGDEIFFHTLLGISPFAASNSGHCVMYTEWRPPTDGKATPHPELFGTADLPRIAAQCHTAGRTPGLPWLFARKFDDNLDLGRYRETFLR